MCGAGSMRFPGSKRVSGAWDVHNLFQCRKGNPQTFRLFAPDSGGRGPARGALEVILFDLVPRTMVPDVFGCFRGHQAQGLSCTRAKGVASG